MDNRYSKLYQNFAEFSNQLIDDLNCASNEREIYDILYTALQKYDKETIFSILGLKPNALTYACERAGYNVTDCFASDYLDTDYLIQEIEDECKIDCKLQKIPKPSFSKRYFNTLFRLIDSVFIGVLTSVIFPLSFGILTSYLSLNNISGYILLGLQVALIIHLIIVYFMNKYDYLYEDVFSGYEKIYEKICGCDYLYHEDVFSGYEIYGFISVLLYSLTVVSFVVLLNIFEKEHLLIDSINNFNSILMYTFNVLFGYIPVFIICKEGVKIIRNIMSSATK